MQRQLTQKYPTAVIGIKPEHAKTQFQEHICGWNAPQLQKHVVTKNVHISDQHTGKFCQFLLFSTKFHWDKIPCSSLSGTWVRGWRASPAAGQAACCQVQTHILSR